MSKLARDFDAVPDGEVYPRRFAAGDEVTGSVERAARDAGALEPDRRKGKAMKAAPENKGAGE